MRLGVLSTRKIPPYGRIFVGPMGLSFLLLEVAGSNIGCFVFFFFSFFFSGKEKGGGVFG